MHASLQIGRGMGAPTGRGLEMKALLLGAVALAALVSPTLAIEGTQGVEAMPSATEAAPYNWSGQYSRLYAPSPYDPSTFSATTPDSFLSGSQVGYNYQMGSLVFGVEADARKRNADTATYF